MRLSTLRETLDFDSPTATVHLDARRGDGADKHALELRWAHLREELTRAGAHGAVVSALEEAVLQPPENRALGGRLVCAQPVDGGDARVVLERETTPPAHDSVRVGEGPALWPLVVEHSRSVPHLLVMVDRTGGRILGEDADGRRVDVEVAGDELHVHKVSRGDWAEPQFQRRSENRWRDNADAVLDVLEHAERGFAHPVVALAGDVKARTLVRERAPRHLHDRLVDVGGGGTQPGDDVDALLAETRRIATLHALRGVHEHVESFRRARGQETGEAVMGAGPVADCLRRGQVAVVLVDADAGPPSAELVRAAADTDTEVVAVPPSMLELTDGVGALLRYRLTDTPADTTT